jgi:hypothetical protein
MMRTRFQCRFPGHPIRFAALPLLLAAGASSAADPPLLELTQTIGLKGPDGKLDHFGLDTKRDRLLVANQISDSLDVVDLKAVKLLKQVPGQKNISGVAYIPDVDRIFVGNSAGGVCNVFDGGSYDLLKSLPFPSADNVRFDAHSGLVYLGHKALAVIDPKTMSVKTDIILPGSSRAFRSEPDRPRLYSNTSNGVVCVVDTDRLEVIARYPIKLAGGNYSSWPAETTRWRWTRPTAGCSSVAGRSRSSLSWTATRAGRSRAWTSRVTWTTSPTTRSEGGFTPRAAKATWSSSSRRTRTTTRRWPRWPRRSWRERPCSTAAACSWEFRGRRARRGRRFACTKPTHDDHRRGHCF